MKGIIRHFSPGKNIFIARTVKVMFSLTLIITLVMAGNPGGAAEALEDEFEYLEYFDLHNLTEREEGYYTVKHEDDGEVVLRTARKLQVGDEYIDAENRHFRIVSIDEDTAWASLVEDAFVPSSPGASEEEESLGERGREPLFPAQGDRLRLGVFHSHGAEAYVSSDGEEFIEEGGGIIQVGETFANALEEEGAEVIHRKETHVPHDAGAYHRSRRTKEELQKENPAALFDVHRDAVPGEEYTEEINGEEMVQILLVVGRQNQNSGLNREFAEGLKQVVNEEHPGLVKGIMKASGNYNQDMHPRSLLLEVGSHENSREDAQESVELASGAVVEHVAADAGQEVAAKEGGGGLMGAGASTAAVTVMWLLLALVAAVAIYLIISTGSWEELKAKVEHFFGREFADVRYGPREIPEERDRDGDNDDNSGDGDHV